MPKSTDATDKVVLLIVSGMPAAELPAAVETLGVAKRAVPQTIKAARAAITQAAHFDRDEQLGAAIVRLQDIYRRAVVAADLRVALSAQKELARMLDLKRPPTKKTAGNEELAAIRGHLLPLKLADDSFPLREHARLAAAAIRKRKRG